MAKKTTATFFKDFSSILNNQRGSLDLGSEGGEESGADTDSGSEDLSTEGLLESINLESESGSESESTSEESSSQEGEEGSKEEDGLEAQLEKFEVDSEDGEINPVLEELNKLGIIHNGNPVEFNDLEEIKEHLSKGFDYTQKTQELSEARKTFDAEIAQERETFNSEREAFSQEQEQNSHALGNYNVFQGMIADIQNSDPELFKELDYHFTKHQQQANHVSPQVEQLQNQVKELESKLNGSVESEEEKQLGAIKETWTKEVGNVQTSFGPKLRSLGIKPDWNKVQEIWKADSTNSMSVKNALFATYGEAIEKAMANKNKIAETRAKVARQGSKPNNDDNEKVFGMTSGNSYENEAFEIMKEL